MPLLSALVWASAGRASRLVEKRRVSAHLARMLTHDSSPGMSDNPFPIDPTGAGDSFAGGFMGYVARRDDLSEASLRRAMIHGSAMGSFVVEGFSVTRLLEVNAADIDRRVDEFHELVAFEKSLRT